MNNKVRAELLKLKEKASSEWVFPNPSAGLPLTDVKTAFKDACRSAGIEDFWFHDLRHTFGTRAADGGAPLTAVASVMGHADIHTTIGMHTLLIAGGSASSRLQLRPRQALAGGLSKNWPKKARAGLSDSA